MKRISFSKLSSGFTLAEVVLAVGFISLFLLAIIGLLGPANKSIMRVLAIDKLSRSYAVVEDYLSFSQGGEHEAVRFARLFNAIKPQPAAGDLIDAGEEDLLVVFSYRAATGNSSADGNKSAPSSAIFLDSNYGLPPVFSPPTDGSTPRQGIDYIVYDAVLPMEDFKNFLPNNNDQRASFLEGEVFVAALVESDVNPADQSLDNYTVTNPDTNGDGQPDLTNTAYDDDYPEAVVVAEVQFFAVDRVDDVGLSRAIGTTSGGSARPAESILQLPMGINR